MGIDIFTPCVQFCDVLSFLARSLLFRVFSFQAHDQRATLATDLKTIYSSCRPLPSLHEVADQGQPPLTTKFCLLDGFQCLLGLEGTVFVCVNAGRHIPQHVCGDEKTS